MSESETRAPRADATRNRDQLLAVATRMFASGESDASLRAIAREAGVGIGTLYRHFPNRNALVEAAYRQEVQQLCEAAPALLDADRPAVDALREWMGRFVRYVAAKRGMGAALRAAVGSDSPLFGETRGRIVDAIGMLLDAGHADGSVRPDVAAEDVMCAMNAVWMVPDDDAWTDRARRLLDLVVDGLRFGAPASE